MMKLKMIRGKGNVNGKVMNSLVPDFQMPIRLVFLRVKVFPDGRIEKVKKLAERRKVQVEKKFVIRGVVKVEGYDLPKKKIDKGFK